MKKTVYFFKKQNFAAGGKGRASFDMAFRDRRVRRRFPKSEKEEEKSVFGGARLGSIFSAWRAAASNDKGHADHACFRFKMLKKS